MANVRKYTEQIASAKKGKDVRAAIVSAINEVSDENNTYNQDKGGHPGGTKVNQCRRDKKPADTAGI